MAVTGSVYRLATASVAPVSDILHMGDAGTVALTIANTAPASSPLAAAHG